MKKGRQANFTAKLVEGRSLDDAGLIARIGDKAATDGARIVREFQFAVLMCRICGTPESKALVERLLSEIGAAIQNNDSKLLRDMADFIDEAAKRAEANRYASPGFSLAAEFVAFCRRDKGACHSSWLDEMAKTPSLKLAIRLGEHTPSIRAILDHVSACLPAGEAPDYKTVERWARVLGIQARPRKPRTK